MICLVQRVPLSFISFSTWDTKPDETLGSRWLFSALCDFSKFLLSPKGPPSLFWYFSTDWIFKTPKRSPFTILKTLRFLSLRYSADFRRSRLVYYFRVNWNIALLVPTLKNQMWLSCKPYWEASIKEQNQTRRPLSTGIFCALFAFTNWAIAILGGEIGSKE